MGLPSIPRMGMRLSNSALNVSGKREKLLLANSFLS
jgi:hypothetical protein